MNDRRRAVVLLVAALLLVTACRKHGASTPSVASRVVSISPSTTEAMFAIGAGQQIVGRSRYCDYPPEASRLPQVGGYVDPSLEAILALRPDLVVGERSPVGPRIADFLESRGIATYFPPTESFAQIFAMLQGLGDRTGRSAEATAVCERLRTRVADVELRVRSLPRVRVLMVFGLEPLSVAGPSSFANEMLDRAGGRNVVDAGGAYPILGIERVIALDPDVVLNAAMAEEHGTERITKTAAGWAKVRAVQQGHVVRLEQESVIRPGPRVDEGLRHLARALHPDAGLE